MKRTIIVNEGTPYVELLCSRKRVFLFRNFWPIEVTHSIDHIDRVYIESERDLASAITRGVIGSALGGLLGCFIGVTSARHRSIYQYQIRYTEDSGLPNMIIITHDPNVIDYLNKRSSIINMWVGKE